MEETLKAMPDTSSFVNLSELQEQPTLVVPPVIQKPAAPAKRYSRRDRRDVEKRLGLLDLSSRTKEQVAEIHQKRMEYGQSIHRSFVQEVYNRLREEDAEREAKQYEGLVELHGKEKADKLVKKWADREAKKRANKAEKKKNK